PPAPDRLRPVAILRTSAAEHFEGDDCCMRADDQQQSGMFSYIRYSGPAKSRGRPPNLALRRNLTKPSIGGTLTVQAVRLSSSVCSTAGTAADAGPGRNANTFSS